MKHKIEYDKRPSGRKQILSVDGFHIMADKHAYECIKCGAVFQSKCLGFRTLFDTDDPKCKTCNNDHGKMQRICECEEIVW